MKKFSKIGFGSYRIDNRIEEHHSSLSQALTGGINLIDTSANYTDGRSEILIGNVINELIENGRLNREDITLVSKGGYMQGKNYAYAAKKKESGKPFEEVVEYEKGLWHCIHPDYLEDQINRQMYRLDQNRNGGYIDVYLLHNPEYYLTNAKNIFFDNKEPAEVYYFRIKKAFEYLEEQVAKGRIRYYGISSNTFVNKSMTFNFTSLERLIKIANEISSANHFKFIQMPFNLIESGAYFEKNQKVNTKSVLSLAYESGIKVLINRPLNGITEKGLVRLADFKYDLFDKEEFLKYAGIAEMMEDDYINEKLVNLNFGEEEIKFLTGLLSTGRTLKNNWDKFGTIEHLNDMIELYFANRLSALIDFFDENITDDDMIKQFDKYIKLIFRLLQMISNHYKEEASKRSKYIHDLINKHLNRDQMHLSLSQKAIMTIASFKEVDCVLIGARKENYVNDVLPLLEMEPFKHPGKILDEIRDAIEKVL